ncbi:sigma-70 family RNA polymerase sigma factor [Bradyrhizobium sp.]|uniref:sigma-70 family RNA polymerase sigma factor n=1 Tax=Bradyrhizobium sp. TaxID=376 RepID=UPI0039E50660
MTDTDETRLWITSAAVIQSRMANVSGCMQTTGAAARLGYGDCRPVPRERRRRWDSRPKATMRYEAEPIASQEAANLVRAIATRRDREAFKELFNFYAPRIKAVLIKGGATGEMAEDLAQETLITVWRKADSYDPGRATVSAWIFTIARNLRIDRFRRDQRAQLHQVYELMLPAETAPPDVPLEAVERESRVRAALDGLPEEQVRVVELSFFEGNAHGDIARKLGIPLGTVKSRLRLAMARLRDFLGENS